MRNDEHEDKQIGAAPDQLDRVLDEFIQRATVGMCLYDRELRFMRINDRLAAMNGVAPDATIGRRLSEVLPDLAERVGPIVRSVFESGQAVEGVEISGETPAEPGRRRHWIASYLPIRLAGSEVVAVGAVVEEVTARQQAEEALRASEARYRYLYLRTPACMHSIDERGCIVDVSDAWLDCLGYTREEVLGRRSVEFLAPESREYAVNEVLPEFFRTGVCKDVAYQLVRKDGTLLDVLLSGVVQRDAEGRFERSLAVLVDVTERKRAEAALRRSEAQLRQAQKMEAVGRLAGGVAHDFNNLLVVMLGNAELLLLALDKPGLREAAEQIVLAGERGAALTRQILRFSRQQVVQPQVVELDELIRDTQNLLRRLLREDIELVTDLHAELGRVHIDPGQATQVLMNLAVNASDAMPHGGRLRIETRGVHVEPGGACSPGEHVRLTVTDTGVGMDVETQARLFEPFFTTKDPGRGTGLGLATVYGIVRQSGGCITVQSEPGTGTSFHVYLPRIDAIEQVDVEPSGPLVSVIGAVTVLVVEDDEMVRKLVTDVLRENGYRVLSARDVEEALRMLAASSGVIDVLLTDVVMPGTAPAILVDQVRARHPQVRVIYMSGYAAPCDAAQIDARDFLAKPFTMDSLLRKLGGART
ncbi:MAG TPA: PAS domain S-box protein [Enhygromyxa sp.]|nr:PAS domain S-box protein [Enhygromyxa sp.]